MKLVLSLISIVIFLGACHEETKTIIIKEKPIIIEEHHRSHARQEHIIVEPREREHRHQSEAEINVTVPMPMPPMPPPPLPHIDMHVHN